MKTALILPWQARKLRQKTETAFLLSGESTFNPRPAPLGHTAPPSLCLTDSVRSPLDFNFWVNVQKSVWKSHPSWSVSATQGSSGMWGGSSRGHGVRKGWVHLASCTRKEAPDISHHCPGPWKDPTTCIQGPALTLSSLLEPEGKGNNFSMICT